MNGSHELSRLFFALSDPTRRDIISRLVSEDQAIQNLAQNYSISLPAISKHLKILEDAKLVLIKKQGRVKRVSLQPENLLGAQIWLETLSDETTQLQNWEQEIADLIDDPDK